MPILDLMPLLVPGILIQVLIQAYYVKHCWENKQLSGRQKVFWLILIILFHLPAAAVYLFVTRKKLGQKLDDQNADQLEKKDVQTEQGIFVFLIIAFEVFALRMIFLNLDSETFRPLALMTGMIFILMLLIGFLGNQIKSGLIRLGLPFLQLMLAAILIYLEDTQSSQMIILTLIAVLINSYPLRWGKIYSAAYFTVYLSIELIQAALIQTTPEWFVDDLISRLYADVLVFILVFASFYLLKRQYLLNGQLASALETTHEQAKRINEMSVLAERQRIIGEIHDTVGHTLTTAIIALEAGDTLMTRDQLAAQSKYTLAARQIKQGLDDLRNAVRTMQKDNRMTFKERMQRLIADMRETTDLAFNVITELHSEPLPIQQSIMLNAVKEFVTNSLKHGDSQSVDLLLQEFGEQYHLIISDDGKGTPNIIFGFGLQTIRNRAESLGGSMTAESQPDEGFSIHLTLPSGQIISDNANTEGGSQHG